MLNLLHHGTTNLLISFVSEGLLFCAGSNHCHVCGFLPAMKNHNNVWLYQYCLWAHSILSSTLQVSYLLTPPPHNHTRTSSPHACTIPHHTHTHTHTYAHNPHYAHATHTPLTPTYTQFPPTPTHSHNFHLLHTHTHPPPPTVHSQKQAHWVDITIGKFELTEWHLIAEEWFKEKPRNSDQVSHCCLQTINSMF